MNIVIPLAGRVRMCIRSSFVAARRMDAVHFDLTGDTFNLMPDGQWVGLVSGGLIVQPARHVIELIVDVSDALGDIGAEMVEHLLVLFSHTVLSLSILNKPCRLSINTRWSTAKK